MSMLLSSYPALFPFKVYNIDYFHTSAQGSQLGGGLNTGQEGCAKGLEEWVVNAWMGGWVGQVGFSNCLFLMFWGWVKLRYLEAGYIQCRGCRCVGLECKFPELPSHVDEVGALTSDGCCRSLMLM